LARGTRANGERRMNDDEAKKERPIDRLPDELHERVERDTRGEELWASAQFDVDEHGQYIESYLVLTDGKLGAYHHVAGRWESRWYDVGDYDEAAIVEGLGMGLMRLLSGGKRAEEFRFTMRHAKEMARLQRQVERQIEGEHDSSEPIIEHRRPDERKVRCDKCGRVIPPWTEVCPACMSRRKILSRLIDFVKPYKGRAALGAVVAVSLVLMELVPPALRKPMIDIGLGAKKDVAPDWGFFVTMWCLWVGVLVVTLVIQALQNRLMAVLGARVSKDIRETVYSHLHKLSLSFFSKKTSGSLVTRTTSDTERLWDFIAFTVVEVVVAFMTLVGGMTMMFVYYWKLAALALLPIPVMLLLMAFFHKRMHTTFRRIWHRWSQMTSVVAGAIPGVRVIKAFGQEDREIDRFHGRSDQVYQEQRAMISIWTTFQPVMQFCAMLSMLVIWLLGGWWVVRDWGSDDPAAMTVGTMMLFVGYIQMFYRPIHQIAHMDRMFNRAATSAQRVFEILDAEPAIFSRSGAHEPDEIKGEIELRNVSFSYDDVRKVLKNVSMKIAPGEMVGLAGPSGGGKTTMINLICRFYDVLEGAILIDGVDVRDYSVEALRKKIGVVLQEPFLFFGTVAENIAYGQPEATLDEIIEASRAANAHDFIVGFPDGYDTIVGERGHSLSGGERQRISIARAILGNPSVLILDEATSSVDTETEQLIQEALDRLIANRTTIAIAHRLSTLHKADRLVILEKGELVEQGTHEELLAKPDGLYAKLIRMQTEMQAIMGA
jgi:ATP-binding cassette subfamily B protein